MQYVCPECHATVAYEGDLPADCIRCGAALSSRDVEPHLIELRPEQYHQGRSEQVF